MTKKHWLLTALMIGFICFCLGWLLRPPEIITNTVEVPVPGEEVIKWLPPEKEISCPIISDTSQDRVVYMYVPCEPQTAYIYLNEDGEEVATVTEPPIELPNEPEPPFDPGLTSRAW